MLINVLPMIIRVIVVCSCILCSNILSADYVQVVRSANIKAEPKSNGQIIESAVIRDEYILYGDGKQKNGYYPVWLDAETNGWIYRSLVKVKRGGSDAAPVPSMGAQSGFNGIKCGRHLKWGVPMSSDQVLCRQGYALGYNYQRKAPDWVAYYLTNDTVHGANEVSRMNNFEDDMQILERYRSQESDYKLSGYDKGHMAPSASIDFNRAANDETFLMSNMAPQLPGFNSAVFGKKGAWGKLEMQVRKWVIKRSELYVVSGTYYEGDSKTIGRNNVNVPSAFFKIILDPLKMEVISFWLPHEENKMNRLPSYVTTVDFIEMNTGLDLFVLLNDSVESLIESHKEKYMDWQ